MESYLIASTGGDCGKTLVAIGLAAAWRRDGITVAPFKKGPDYIDPAWLTLAAGRPARNLDTWMMGAETVCRSFAEHAVPDGINLVEGNRGLYDGVDAHGTHSSAELAKLLGIPVILVLSGRKSTRTTAAIALGMKLFDPAVRIAGIILNQIANERQAGVMRTAIESATGIPVIGTIPSLPDIQLPGRHLGLVTPEEHKEAIEAIERVSRVVSDSVDLSQLRKTSSGKEECEMRNVKCEMRNAKCEMGSSRISHFAFRIRIGYFKSPAFTFYYPENLEAIQNSGAQLIAVDPLLDGALPELDALYIGGGFPETHAERLAGNTGFLQSVRKAAEGGLPVWAECGGLMYLSKAIEWRGSSYPMAGFLPTGVQLRNRPEGHGYMEVAVDCENAFVPVGTVIRGHEFHYSQVTETGLDTVLEVRRGCGVGNGRDGIVKKNVFASYLHIHALATPGWIEWLIRTAESQRTQREN
jgi:cobyrinic acid a,c-diamide synthase